MPDKSGVADQIISLPKGGGAVAGIGDKFQPDLHTGTGNFDIPIAVPPGRNGMQPKLALGYSTGHGNGPFGLGWSLNLPGISRKTSKGIPRYSDDDVFVLSAAEDLILIRDEPSGAGRPLRRRHYRPRTEGLFAQIVYVSGSGADHWEVTSKSGIVSIYGRDEGSRLYEENHADRTRVFHWFLSETEDMNGNRIEYTYKREDRAGLSKL